MQNLKNVENNFKFHKIELYDKVYNEGSKYLQNLQNNNNINIVNNKQKSLQNIFKTLNYHTEPISHLSKLNDGRIISCSWDNS